MTPHKTKIKTILPDIKCDPSFCSLQLFGCFGSIVSTASQSQTRMLAVHLDRKYWLMYWPGQRKLTVLITKIDMCWSKYFICTDRFYPTLERADDNCDEFHWIDDHWWDYMIMMHHRWWYDYNDDCKHSDNEDDDKVSDDKYDEHDVNDNDHADVDKTLNLRVEKVVNLPPFSSSCSELVKTCVMMRMRVRLRIFSPPNLDLICHLDLKSIRNKNHTRYITVEWW